MSPATHAPAQDSGLQPTPDGISAFIAKVLDQLSLSAWLPSGAFRGNPSVIVAVSVPGVGGSADGAYGVDKDHMTTPGQFTPIRLSVSIDADRL